MPSHHNFVYDTEESDNAARQMYADITSSIERELSRIGLVPVFDDTVGALAVRVANERHLGTAYFEVRDHVMRMRLVLFEEVTDDEPPDKPSSDTMTA